MKGFLKRHVGMIIVLILLLVFPTSLSSQAKLNMRIIVTGLAIDKVEEGYEVTAQIVKNTPGTESPGTSATLEFISSKAETISLALANLSYKAGKVAAFSHTSYVILGDNLKDEATKCLDYFLRDKIIKSSTMLVFATGKASDEIRKTKDIELSVGLGLQKVFLYKENESDGLMTTILEFLKSNNSFSKTALASTIILESGESSDSNGGSSGSEQSSGGLEQSEGTEGETSNQGQSSSGSESSSGSSSGGMAGGSSGSSGQSTSSGSSGGTSGSKFFKENSPVLCFVGGKFACKFEGDDWIGFMISNKNTTTADITLDSIDDPDLKNAKVAITIKNKKCLYDVRYENGVPCVDVKIFINNAEINEILKDEILRDITDTQYKAIEKSIRETISKLVAGTFETAKSSGADIFDAYEKAYKTKYTETTMLFDTPSEFVENLKLNVDVVINKLDF